MGSISLGEALVAGKKRVPSPAAGNIALFIVLFMHASLKSRYCGAGDEGRTRTMRASRDFKSENGFPRPSPYLFDVTKLFQFYNNFGLYPMLAGVGKNGNKAEMVGTKRVQKGGHFERRRATPQP